MNLGSRRRLAGAGIVLVGLAGSLGVLAALARPPAYRPRPLTRELLDLGVACVASGEVVPAVGELTDAELESLVEILARLIAAYERADFDSFLALRRADLEFAGRVHRARVGELRQICAELGVAPDELPEEWVGLLGAYWSAYYRQPPVARFLPERTRLALHRDGLGARSVEAWEADFAARCAARPGARIDHHMAAPHRRALERVAADGGDLRWLDLELEFEAHDGGGGALCARFVWDDLLGEWFLHRATTVLDEEARDDRRQLVL